MKREKPSADETAKYRRSRAQQALYKAASQLWTKGVSMPEAISIVSEAVNRAAEN